MSTPLQELAPEESSRQEVLPPWMNAYLPARRYKIAYGGRGSSKSWSFARMALLRGIYRPLRILCAREFQVSIKDSVHNLLARQIQLMGLDRFYTVKQTEIRGKNHTHFLFKGLRHNAQEIKSTEGVNLCWVEEAQSVSDESWDILIPTIRETKSEIWVTFNPDRESDPTFKRFVINTPPGSICRKINHDSNPWFPAELDAERQYLQRVDPEAYAHVWLGECRTHSDALVLAGKYGVEPFEPRPDWDGPYYGADWGFAQDPSVLVRAFIHERVLYIRSEAYGIGVDINKTPDLFDHVPGGRGHTIRADSARPETISYMRQHGYPNMRPAVKWTGCVEDGAAHLRSFEHIVIHPDCRHTIDEAGSWQYKRDRLSGDVLPELVDKNNHCMDALRYALEPMIRQRGMLLIG